MTAYPSQTWMTLGLLCIALWDSQSWPDVIQPGFEPGTVVMLLALRSLITNISEDEILSLCPLFDAVVLGWLTLHEASRHSDHQN